MQQWIKAVSLSTVFFLSGCEYIDDMPVVGRYIAKNVCAGLFVEGFEEDLLIKEYITPVVPVINNTWKVNVDYDEQTVSVSNSLFSGAGARAIYRPPIGCVSPINESDEELLAQAPYALEDKLLDDQQPWPYGSGGAPENPVDGVDYGLLDIAMENAFFEPGQVNTVAMVVIYDGQLVAERYAGGIDEFSPLKGYSMSKSLINGLMGQLQADGTFDITETTGLPEWADDERASITLEQLMRMESGLQYTERAIGNNNDQGKVLYGNQPPLVYAASLPLQTAPGSQFNYSSADNVILGTLIQDELGGIQPAYEFYKDGFFNRIDAVTALLEHDVQGYFSNAESVFLSARDWARFALLYMNKGEWNGEQILSRQWVEETLTPGESYKGYGRNIWTNIDQVALPKLPEDTFAFVGALERFVIGVPSRKTIVVRIGFSHNRTAVDINDIVNEVLLALPETQ